MMIIMQKKVPMMKQQRISVFSKKTDHAAIAEMAADYQEKVDSIYNSRQIYQEAETVYAEKIMRKF